MANSRDGCQYASEDVVLVINDTRRFVKIHNREKVRPYLGTLIKRGDKLPDDVILHNVGEVDRHIYEDGHRGDPIILRPGEEHETNTENLFIQEERNYGRDIEVVDGVVYEGFNLWIDGEDVYLNPWWRENEY